MKKILLFTIVISMLLSMFVFNTYAKEYSYEDMADFLNKLDILHGDASKGGDYDFYSNLTRAQFAKMAIAASTYKNSVPIYTNTSPYSDVSRDHWAAGYIKVAATNKIITGYPDSTFKPENPVLLEEAVTIVLKLLGYTNSDFGGEWPYGQMGIANNIGILENVTATMGSEIKRVDAIALLYNTLNEDTKSGTAYLQTIGYQLIEDVVLVASSYQDSGIDKDKVVTSNGTYKVSSGFDFSMVGSRGDVLIKNNKEIAGFFSDSKSSENYVIMGVLGEDIIVSSQGRTTILDLTPDTEAYYNSTKTTASALSSKVKTGDSIKVIKDQNEIKYVVVDKQTMDGPYRVSSLGFIESILSDSSSAIVIKGGNAVSVDNIAINDIIYYSEALNTIWAYSDKRVGIYEEAIPNQEAPIEVVISGIKYSLESAEAFSKLSSTGNVKLGQTITVLLGKDGKIADVVTNGTISDEIYGLALQVGKKEFDIKGEKYISNYISIATTDGNVYEYETNTDYSGCRGKAVKLSFENSVAKVTVVNGGGGSGVFNYSLRSLGSNKLSSALTIIDAKKTTVSENGEFVKIYPLRIENVELRESDILYCEKDSKGEITGLILNDVTGDNYQYGMIVSASERGGTRYMINGAEKSSGTYFTLKANSFAKLDVRNNQLNGVYALSSFSNISEFTDTYIKDASGRKYKIADNVQVYQLDYSMKYNLITLSEAIKNSDKYSVSGYYDEPDSLGGRVRIIVLR